MQTRENRQGRLILILVLIAACIGSAVFAFLLPSLDPAARANADAALAYGSIGLGILMIVFVPLQPLLFRRVPEEQKRSLRWQSAAFMLFAVNLIVRGIRGLTPSQPTLLNAISAVAVGAAVVCMIVATSLLYRDKARLEKEASQRPR